MSVERRQMPETIEFTRYGRDNSRLTVERVGHTPTAFFVSGLDGDERDLLDPLRTIMKEKQRELGAHVRVLTANPEAVETGETEIQGIEMNREFPMNIRPDYPQAQLLADIFLEHKGVHTLFSFHETPEDDEFYYYYQTTQDEDGSLDPMIERLHTRLIETVESLGVPAYTGIDDIDLGYWVNRGLCAVAADSYHDDTFEMWALQNSVHRHPAIKRAFTFEIPGKLPLKKKEQVLRAIFEELITPYLAQVH